MKYILGATTGDIIGSIYEFNNIKTTDFPLFSDGCCATDDSIMTFATMDVLLNNGDYTETYQKYGRKYLPSFFIINIRKKPRPVQFLKLT